MSESLLPHERRFVTVADSRYVDLACRLARSVSRHASGALLDVVDVGLGAEDRQRLGALDNVTINTPRPREMVMPGPPDKARASTAKLSTLLSAAGQLVYLDADVELNGDVSHLFTPGLHVLRDQEQALEFYLQPGQGPRRRALSRAVVGDLPQGRWSNFNSGVIAGDADSLRRLATHWQDLSRRYRATDPSHYYDQVAFSVAVEMTGAICDGCEAASPGEAELNFDTRRCAACRERRCLRHAALILHDIGAVRPWS